MTNHDIIQKVNRLMPHTFTDGDILSFINEANDIVFSEVIERLDKTSTDLIKDQTKYTIPAGISSYLIKEVRIAGKKYHRVSITSREASGFSVQGDSIVLNTNPSSDKLDGLELIYRAVPSHQSEESAYTDEVLIPIQYSILYEYYIYYRISLLNDEFGKANNYTILFNEMLEDLRMFIAQHTFTNDSKEEVESRWR